MLNILKAMLRQTKRDKLLLIGLFYFLLMAGEMLVQNGADWETHGSTVSGILANTLLIMTTVVAGAFTGRICGSDLRDKTANYEILFGKHRSAVYFGRFFAALTVSVAVIAGVVLIPVLFLTAKNGWGGAIPAQTAWVIFGLLLVMIFRCVCFFTALTFLCGNDIVPLSVALIGTMCVALCVFLLDAADIHLSWQTTFSDIMTLLDFSNTTSGYADGKDYLIYKVALSGKTALRMLCTSLGFGLFWLFGGFALFRKKDIP